MRTCSPSICILLNSFWVHGRGMTGGDQMSIQIFKRISSDFHKVYWVTSYSGRDAVLDECTVGKILYTPRAFDKINLGLSYLSKTIIALFKIINLKMTYLYSGSDFFPDVLPALIYKKFNPNTKWVQCVFHLYPHWKKRPGNFFINFFGYYLQKISLFYIKRADIVININEEVKSELVKIGFESKKISIITPGIDIKKINNFVSTNLEKRNYEYEVIYMGRLNPSKGVQDLTKIWEEIRKINPKNIPRLAIIGGGSSSAIRRLESNIENSGMSSVISILGFLPQEEVYSIFSSAKVFILPSYEEGFGIVIAEAFAFGLPVVAWDLPIYENLFGPGVHRVCIGNVKRFAKKIDQLLNSININRDALKEFAQKYDWDKKAEYMRNLLILNNEIIE